MTTVLQCINLLARFAKEDYSIPGVTLEKKLLKFACGVRSFQIRIKRDDIRYDCMGIF